jgi:uncharacterized protein YjdB
MDLTNGLLAYWPFDGNANDASGNGSNGVFQGQTIIQSGIKGGSASFRGESLGDYISIPQNNIDSIVSVSVWVKVTGFNLGCWSGAESIISRGYYGAGNHFTLDVYRNENPNCGEAPSLDSVGFILEYSNNVRITTRRSFSPNQWYHVVGVYDDNRLKLYVNNILVAESQLISGVFSAGRDRLFINSFLETSGGNGRMGGMIDELRLYDRALNTSEIESLYNDPANRPVLDGPQFVCQGQASVNYSVSEIANATSYKWILPTGATGFSTTNNIIVDYGSSAMSGTIIVTGHNDTGDLETYTLGVTINTLPASPGSIFGSTSVCKENNPVTYKVASQSTPVSYLWTLPDGTTGSGTTNSIALTFSDDFISGKLKVRLQNRCGLGEESVLDLVKAPCKTIVYVTESGAGLMDGTSWSNALGGNLPSFGGYRRLGYELLSATSGTQFWIAEGTYKACTDNDREKSFELGQNIKLYGGFQGTETDTLTRNIALHPTIFSGDIGIAKDSTDNTRTILKTVSGVWYTWSLINGIEFIGAYNDKGNGQGAGILNTGWLSLRNCKFMNNYSSSDGGGIANYRRIAIDRCLFFNNNAGWGGGLSSQAGIADIRSSRFIGNSGSYGGAISAIMGGSLTLINSIICNNSGSHGAGINTFSPYWGGSITLINTTIANNAGYDIELLSSTFKSYNSIIWGGSGIFEIEWAPSTKEVKNSIIQNYSSGSGSLNMDPKFVEPSYGQGPVFKGLVNDWSVLCSSPAIDAGDPGLLPPEVTTDIDGNPRNVNSTVDIGAYESQFAGVNSINCPDSKGVNLELFQNASPGIEVATTNSASRVLKLLRLGAKALISTSGENSYRIRGYLIPPKSGYYKFYLSNKSMGSFYLSTDSMEYHKILVAESSSNDVWPSTWTNSSPGITIHTDSLLLTMGRPYYFEVRETFPLNSVEACGLRWALPGSRSLAEINYTNLSPAGPRMPRSELKWEIFTNRNSFNPGVLSNTDSLPNKTVLINSLQTKNFSDTLNHFNSRIRGFIVPEISGTYNFFFAADDEGQFWLSSDTSEVNAQLKSSISSSQPDWKQNISSQTLEAEKKYYFEIMQHDSSGDDGIKLGWALDGDNEPVVIGRNYILGQMEGFAPQRLKFSKNQFHMAIGQDATPIYQVFPWYADTTVTWRSTDPTIVTVDQKGQNKAVGYGDCKIIIKSIIDSTVTDTIIWNVNRVELEVFKNRFSWNLDQLKDANEPPDDMAEIGSLNQVTQTIVHTYYRIRGYLIPPVSGNYSFYFGCDQSGQFWLSTDTCSANACLMSNITTSQEDWTQNMSNQELLAGNIYYFELLHRVNVLNDLIKLGWKIPGKDSVEIIEIPNMIGWSRHESARKLTLNDQKILSFPGCHITPPYFIEPFNTTNKKITWRSTNSGIAQVNENGTITMISKGNCMIIAAIKENPLVADTLEINITDYYGPYFVKNNATSVGSGHSWEDPIELTSLLYNINLGDRQQMVTICIAEGTYKSTSTTDRTKSFMFKNARVFGGFDAAISGVDTITRDWIGNETILSGNIGDPDSPLDNSFHVVVTGGLSSIDGFTIRDGRASSDEYGTNSDICGGGINGGNLTLKNSRITNNQASWRGGGMNCGGITDINNCMFERNTMIASSYSTGGMFEINIARFGGGIHAEGTLNVNDCEFRNNEATVGSAIAGRQSYYVAALNIEKSSFVGNSIELLWGATLNLRSSTLQGDIKGWMSGSINITNSTVIGMVKSNVGGYPASVSCDNSIVTAISEVDNLLSKYSIVGNNLYGSDKTAIISYSVPIYSTWLDTLNYNGGPTRTMRLKRVAGNPAIGNGNPEYLGTTDQRGAIRTGSVSIGSYHEVIASGVTVTPQEVTLCSGSSVPFSVNLIPDFARDTTFTATTTDNTIAYAENGKIYGLLPGTAKIIITSTDGGYRDTCTVMVTSPVGTGSVSGSSSVKKGQTSVEYTTTSISNAATYIWTISPSDAGIISGTGITAKVDFSSAFTGTAEIKVAGQNICGTGTPSEGFNVTILPSLENTHFVPAWWPGNGTEHMNLYALTAKLDNHDLQAGDEIGIFDGDLCVGVGVLTKVLDGSGYLAIAVSKDDTDTPEKDGYSEGNNIIFKVWDSDTGSEVNSVEATYVSGQGIFSAGAGASFNLSATTMITQTISLASGWNIISFAAEPANMSLVSIVDPLVTANIQLKVQDEKGNAIEKLPFPIGWVNSIGQMSVTKGYKIKVTGSTTLSITGRPVSLPYTIPLSAGWNIMGYPIMTSQAALTAFDPLVTAGTLLKVQDEKGNAIEKLPVLGWIDNVKNLNGGKGYKVKTSVGTTLNITAPAKGESIAEERIKTPASHFKTAWSGNGLDHMNIYITKPTLGGEGLRAGDEIGVFDGDVCVGSVVIEDAESGFFMAAASLDDAETEERDGYKPGDKLELMLWDSRSGIERSIKETQYEKGYTNLFEKNGTTMLKADFEREGKTVLYDAWPNPSSRQTTFRFTLEAESDVTLELYNSRGNLVKVLVKGKLYGGDHSIEWNNSAGPGEKVAGGVYFYRLKSNNFNQTRKLVIR